MGLLAPQRGIELLAQGNALGKMMSENSPCKKFSVEGVYHFPLRKLAKKDGKAEEIMGDAKTQLIELKFGYKIKLF